MIPIKMAKIDADKINWNDWGLWDDDIIIADDPGDILKLFEVRHGSMYARGYAFFCRRCGTMAFVRSEYFPCQKAFVITKISCRFGCGKNTWKLKRKIKGMKHGYLL